MTDNLSEKIGQISSQIRRRYHSTEGHLAALDHAIAELLKLAEISPDPDVTHLLAEAREQRILVSQRTTVYITTPEAMGDWVYIIKEMESLLAQGYMEFVDDVGRTHATYEMLYRAKQNASDWSRKKAIEYMSRARDLLPIAPLAALNYLNKIHEFPELPQEIDLDVQDMVSAANELLKTHQDNEQDPIRFAAMIHLINNKVDLLNKNQHASSLQIEQLRSRVLEKIAGIEIAMVQVVKSLDENGLESLSLVAQAIDDGKIAREECITILNTIYRTIRSLRANNKPVPEVTKAIETYVGDAKVDATHRLKITVPIIPLLLDYEGELDLGTDVNLRKLWDSLVKKAKNSQV